jgi:hypothetical protein
VAKKDQADKVLGNLTRRKQERRNVTAHEDGDFEKTKKREDTVGIQGPGIDGDRSRE